MLCQICGLRKAVTRCVGCGEWLCESCLSAHLSDYLFPPYKFIKFTPDERSIFYPSWS